MAYYPSTKFVPQFFDDNGVPLSGGKLNAYLAGSSTPTNMFTDADGTVAGTTITLNARGEPAVSGNTVIIWLDDSVDYKFTLQNASLSSIWTVDIAGEVAQETPVIKTFATIAAATGANLVAGNIALVKEYATGKGIIGATYDVVAAGTGTADGFEYHNDTIDGSTFQLKLRIPEGPINAMLGGVNRTNSAATNTTLLQAILDTFSVTLGGIIFIPEGCPFNLSSLDLPARSNIEYIIDDDSSNQGLQGSGLGSGERVIFSSNSSYPTDPTGGAVNEFRYESPYHPAFVVDVRKDCTSAGDNLGGGQSLTEPVRVSHNFSDEQITRCRWVYEVYGTGSNFSGHYFQGFQSVVRLTGIGTSSYSTVPSAGAVITGSVSGATGFLKEVAAGYTDVYWFSGTFAVGDAVTDDDETTTDTASAVTLTLTAASYLGQDLESGAWTLGDRPFGIGTELLNVAGNIKVVPTRDGNLVAPKTVTKPTYVLGGNPEAGTPHQLGIQYDPALKTDATRRLIAVPNDLTTYRGEWCPVGAMCAFNDNVITDTNATNIASITNPATGKYTVTFTNNLARTAYIPLVSCGSDGSGSSGVMAGWAVNPESFAVGSVQLWVYNASNVLADIPAGGIVSLVVLGGDV